MNHSFDVDVAKEVGVLAATVFNSIGFWVAANRANGRNLEDGTYWTYNTVEAWTELFPYATRKQVYTALRKLIDAGLVKTGCYNKNPYDRTLWYALTEKGEQMFDGSGPDDCADREDGNLPNGKIESSGQDNLYTVTNTDSKPDDIPYKAIIEHLNERTGKHYKCVESTKRLIRARINDGYTVDDFMTVIDKMCDDRMGTDLEKYLRPATLFSPSHFDDYLNWKVSKKEARLNGSTRAGVEARGFSGNASGWSPVDVYDG